MQTEDVHGKKKNTNLRKKLGRKSIFPTKQAADTTTTQSCHFSEMC